MNPELLRNSWLELTPTRLGFTAVVIALVYATASLLSADSLQGSATLLILYLVAGLWGSRRAADAVPGELEARTWDTQRLSAIGPWSMCWGKLAGATSLAWFTAALTLIGHASAGAGADGRWSEIAAAVAACALWQAVSFWMSLLLLRVGGRRLRGHTTVAQLIGFWAVTMASAGAFPRAWYGFEFDPYLSRALLAGALALLALFGAWRAMRVELQFRNLPWGLTLGLALIFALQAGFHPLDRLASMPMVDLVTTGLALSGGLLLAATTLLAAVSVTTLLSPKDPIAIRAWFDAARTGFGRRALELQPPFVTALVVAFIATAAGTILADRATGFLLPSLFLLALRDAALILALTIGARLGRGHLAALVLLGLLHGVIPLLARALFGSAAEAAFRPEVSGFPAWLLVQAAIAIALAGWRFSVAGALPSRQKPAALSPI